MAFITSTCVQLRPLTTSAFSSTCRRAAASSPRCCLATGLEVFESTLSASAALHEKAASGVGGTIRVQVSSVGALVRGQTIAAALQPTVAPMLQDEEQARHDLMRRGAALYGQQHHTEADVKEMEMLNFALQNLPSARVPRYRVIDDHPNEPWVTVEVDAGHTAMGEHEHERISDGERNERALVAVQQFVNEVIAHKRLRMCPYTESAHWAGTGAGSAEITPGTVRYISSEAYDCASLVSSTLQAGVQMLDSNEEDVSTVLLLLGGSKSYCDNVDLFNHHAAYLTAVIEHSGLGEWLDIVLFHPDYSARGVYPPLAERQRDRTYTDKGHLPPPEQVAALAVAKSMTASAGAGAGAGAPQQLGMAHDYARRAPVPVINILRAAHLKKLSASGSGDKAMLYVRNACKLADVGVDRLQRRLDEWVRYVNDDAGMC